ncbi:MAG: hypothetical protein WCW84_00905 [Sulfurimonas sp.]
MTHSKTLTVSELIEKLLKLPQDALMVVDGYEGGFDGVVDVSMIGVNYDESKEWYYGPYEQSEQKEIVAVYLHSTRGERL